MLFELGVEELGADDGVDADALGRPFATQLASPLRGAGHAHAVGQMAATQGVDAELENQIDEEPR